MELSEGSRLQDVDVVCDPLSVEPPRSFFQGCHAIITPIIIARKTIYALYFFINSAFNGLC